MAEILIIDDEAPVRTLVRRALGMHGHDVTEAHDGLQGIARYAAAPTDLVITDLVMDGMEGMDTIRGIRRLNPDVPILAISGGGRGAAGDYLTIAAALGATETMEKPFGLQELSETVERLLEGSTEGRPKG